MFADQFSQEYEHAEKPKDFSHAQNHYWVNFYRFLSMTRFAATVR